VAKATHPIRLHATCVAIAGQGVLIVGESGTGKSDLALRLMDRGALLVADDQVVLTHDGVAVSVGAPERISGLLELRGVGIFQVKALESCPLALVVQLVKQEWIDRLPYPEPYPCFGLEIPQMRLWGFEASAAIKVEMALAALQDDSMTVGVLKE
jgi:serine kinase of HPr protein (carbohydrate metabolism regulator)